MAAAGRNFVRDFVATRARDDNAVVTLSAAGRRQRWSYGELLTAVGGFAGELGRHGVTRGSTVLLLVGNRIEYVVGVLACLHVGAAAMPCSEQLRPKDLAFRLARAHPSAIVCDARNLDVLTAAGPDCPVIVVGDDIALPRGAAPPAVDLDALDPAFVLFTSGTSGEPKMVTHGQRYVWGQRLQAREWMAAQPGELVWSTASPGWSKSARNSFIAPWLCGAQALLQDGRFDPDVRLDTMRREQVNVLCMAPTEYRLIAAHRAPDVGPAMGRLITAGEAPGIPVVDTWREHTGLVIADGYGQTETGHLAGVRPGEIAPPGSMGRPLPGIDVQIIDGELTVDPLTVPSFFLGYDGEPAPPGRWRTGDQVAQDEDGWLYFEARTDDVIMSSGYRIGPVEVEAALLGHPAVREVAVIGTPDADRGQVVTAFVVLRSGYTASDSLVAELQAHTRTETAPYKYPRRVEFVDELPKTHSGKVHRAALK
jgi:acyl-coenzyme A synthetase/AMP-(fatty) acid ligase